MAGRAAGGTVRRHVAAKFPVSTLLTVALESQTGCGAHPAPIRVPTARQPGHEAHQLPPASDVVKNERSSTSTPPYMSS
jgi:hypothetical protein